MAGSCSGIIQTRLAENSGPIDMGILEFIARERDCEVQAFQHSTRSEPLFGPIRITVRGDPPKYRLAHTRYPSKQRRVCISFDLQCAHGSYDILKRCSHLCSISISGKEFR